MERNTVTIILDDGMEMIWEFNDPALLYRLVTDIQEGYGDADSIRY